MLKEKLIQLIEKYNGSLRFIKVGNLQHTCGVAALPEIESVTSFLNKTTSLQERVYCYINDIVVQPVCKTCQKDVKFRSNPTSNGTRYPDYCSSKCSAMNNNTQNKKRITNLKIYGSTNVLNSAQIKEKRKTALIQKFGVTNYFLSDEYKKNKPSYNKPDYEVISSKLLDRGYSLIAEHVTELIPQFTREEYKGVGFENRYPWICKTCNTNFTSWLCSSGQTLKCPTCYRGTNIERKVSDILTETNITFIRGSKSILDKSKQLDFYIPDKQLAIETHGLYWHRECDTISKSYHLLKLEECLSKNIRLIQIFADELEFKLDIVKSRLHNYLSKNPTVIYGRECTIHEIDQKEAAIFLNQTHIQGSVYSKFNYGLKYQNKLVALLGFTSYRNVTGSTPITNEYELTRFSTALFTSVIGGFSKLLQHFIKTHSPKKIISYCDRRWSEGAFYTKCGFNLVNNSPPNYWYLTLDYKSRLHRYNYQKHKLSALLENFNPELTEYQNMQLHGFDRIWDCGNKKFELVISAPSSTTPES